MWWGWGVERERERDSSSTVPAEHGADAGLHLMTLRSWLEQKPRVGCLTDWATHCPPDFLVSMSINFNFWNLHLFGYLQRPDEEWKRLWWYTHGLYKSKSRAKPWLTEVQGFALNLSCPGTHLSPASRHGAHPQGWPGNRSKFPGHRLCTSALKMRSASVSRLVWGPPASAC